MQTLKKTEKKNIKRKLEKVQERKDIIEKINT
jgi:hypothetical protein